jgi:osmoprotectant transport system substrate-binding protein
MEKEKPIMRMNRVLALGAAMLVLFSACTSGGGSTTAPTASPSSPATASLAPTTAPTASPSTAAVKPTIKIGSDGFYESALVAEMYAQVLEHAGYTVERHLKLGPRATRQPALESGAVDLVPGYVGSELAYYDPTKDSGDGEANRTALQTILTTKGGGITVLNISPAQDSNAFVVRSETATALNLSKMSDLAAVQTQLKWGLPSECDTNNVCKGALVKYGITYPPAKRQALAACDVPMATALQGKAIDVAELCSTQPAIAQFGFIQLADDLKTQPAENIIPMVRNDYLAKVDSASFEALLNAVSAKLTTADLTTMGVDVAVNQKDVAVVAKAWLTTAGLLN